MREALIKRSQAITLILIGTGAAALVASMYPRRCHNDQGEEVSCRSSSRSWIGFGKSHSSSFSNRPQASQTTVSRGGFGATGSSYSVSS